MAITLELLGIPAGLTGLVAKLFPEGSDTIANGAGGDALSYATNRSGYMSATVAEALSGFHTVHVEDGSGNLIFVDTVLLEGDGTTCRNVIRRPEYDEMEGFFQIALRSDSAIDTDRATLVSAINADEGSGVGDYTPLMDSQEAANFYFIAINNLASSIQSVTSNLPNSGALTDIAAAITAIKAVTDVLDVYWADIKLNIDEANTQDEYTVRWYKNAAPLTSGVTVPTIQVIDRATGADLIASTSMSEDAGASNLFRYDETTNRITSGQDVDVIVTAAIDSSTRTFNGIVGRDSSA